MVDRKQAETLPHLKYFLSDRPKTALPFWFFGGFRYDVWLFIVLFDKM